MQQLQGLRVLSRLRRSSLANRFSSSSSAALPHQPDHSQDDQVLVNGRANSRMALLNRPSLLNSLNTPMVARLKRLCESWEENSNIGFVLMKGSGKAFCSGTDVVSLYHWIQEGNTEDCRDFFETLYKLVYLQATYLKPHVAILDGITMGSGAGISLPGMFRLATDKTVFAHPEVQIGFHPDAGASFYLSRLPGYLGEYLALTGDRLNGVEMVACGLATHYCLNARLSLMDERLSKLTTDAPSVIDTSLAQYGDLVFPDRSSILNRIKAIDKCFGHDSVEEIVQALETEVAETQDDWSMRTLLKIKEASPLSLKVTLRSIREGRFQSLDQCLAREFQISLRGTCGSVSRDFREGVRARLVDKDFAPKWDPPSLAEVPEEMVNRYFLPAEETEPVLELPTSSREPFV